MSMSKNVFGGCYLGEKKVLFVYDQDQQGQWAPGLKHAKGPTTFPT